MVSNIVYFHSYIGKWSNLTNIFQTGWNHQLEYPLLRLNLLPGIPPTFWCTACQCCESFIWTRHIIHVRICKVYLPTFGIFLYGFHVGKYNSSHGLFLGILHFGPGNLKYMRDGRICFLDFGLMDRVPARIMEGFADGIRSVVSQNWTALAHSMQVVECVPDPVKRDLEGWRCWRF